MSPLKTVSPTLRRLLLGHLAGAVGVALVGTALVRDELLRPDLGQGLATASYELPFRYRSELETPGVVIVFVDEGSRKSLGQTPTGRIERRPYVDLLRRLTAQRAATVVFDVVFEDEEPAVDAELADAIRAHGRVVVGGYEANKGQKSRQAATAQRQLITTHARLAAATTNWGMLMVVPEDPRVTRRPITALINERETAPWATARLEGAPVTRDSAAGRPPRWVNYYGPTCPFEFTTLAQALAPDGVPPEFFADKVVFVGGMAADLRNANQEDVFATPYTAADGRLSPGVELLATQFLNLKRGEWLEEMSRGWELACVLLCGVLAGGALLRLRPWHAAWVAVVAAVAITAGSMQLQFQHRIWWPWLVPVAVQLPLGLVWSVGYQYAIEGGRRRRLLKAFSAYVSPHLAQRVAESEQDLRLGGRTVEATILFSDLEGFTAKSEGMDPAKLSEMLTAYFTRLTRHIYDQEGTVIKFLGDGLMAVWGAPLPDGQHAARAVRAAWRMVEASGTAPAGDGLHTRIGVNTGPVLAGNLGSAYRFDYTVIGATTNLASRLEGLNKLLGTSFLISEATRAQLGDEFWLRPAGCFLLRGTSRPVTVFEVCGLKEPGSRPPEFLAPFAEALAALDHGDHQRASAFFAQAREQRGGADGPAEFYLHRLAGEPADPPPSATGGHVVDLRQG